MELIDLYTRMARARAFELALAGLWHEGRISGEMHLGTGEEALIAGVTAHLGEGDAVALDHRPTPALTMLGVDMRALLYEMLGHDEGLCRGRGGHMHLFSQEHLAASSGIVGSAGPVGAGFALAAKVLRRGKISVAFFGDGAINQGMLLESFNLAVAWSLPVVFVCKDNGWAITTRSETVTGGKIIERAAGFGLETFDVDGLEADVCHEVAGEAIDRARRGKGPAFIHARCARSDGHMLGDLMVRVAQHPLSDGRETFGKIMKSVLNPAGGGIVARTTSVASMMNLLRKARQDHRGGSDDPLVRAQHKLGAKHREAIERIDQEALAEVTSAVERVTGLLATGGVS